MQPNLQILFWDSYQPDFAHKKNAWSQIIWEKSSFSTFNYLLYWRAGIVSDMENSLCLTSNQPLGYPYT